MQKVRAELAPWEREMAEVRSRLDIAAAERDLLTQQQTDAQQRLQVGHLTAQMLKLDVFGLP